MTIAVIAGLLVCVVAVTSLVFVGNATHDQDAKLSEIQAQTEQMLASGHTVAGNSRDLAGLQRSAVATQTLAAVRYNWPALFARIAGVLPSGISLDSLTGSLAGASDSTSSSTSTSETSAGGTLAISGCASSLDNLANGLVRMRRVTGVEDVTLGTTSHTGGKSCSQTFNATIAITGLATTATATPATTPTATTTTPAAASTGGA